MAQSTYKGDPVIIDGDLVKTNGYYERTCNIDNMIAILVGTDSGYWGNAIESERSQIPGGMEKFDGKPITSTFLEKYAAGIKKILQPLIDNGYVKTIIVEATNPDSDRIDWTAKITLADGSPYSYNSVTGGCK
jgi:phage gp46-like protein